MAPPLYILYQVSFRAAVAQPVIQAEWNAKTKAQKLKWKNAYLNVRDTENRVHDLELEADDLRQRLDENLNNSRLEIRNKRHYAGYLDRVREVRDLYQRLDLGNTDLATAYKDLVRIEGTQTVVNDSVNHALSEGHAAAIERGHTQI